LQKRLFQKQILVLLTFAFCRRQAEISKKEKQQTRYVECNFVPATGVKLGLGFVFRVEYFELAAQHFRNYCGAQSAPHRGHKVTTISKQNLLQNPTDAAVLHFGCCDKIIFLFLQSPL
jgi:hypothetical protein